MKTNLKSSLILDNCLLKKEKHKNECYFSKIKVSYLKNINGKTKKKSLNC